MIKLAKVAAKSPPEADRGAAAQLPEELSASTEPGSPKPTPALIVFGPDKDEKPHASWFAEADVALATKAAAVMGMRTLQLTDEAALAIAAQLPQGRVFASGRAFVPFVAKGLYARLSALAGPGEVSRPRRGCESR